MKEKEYFTNGEVTIVWDESQCIHVGYCIRDLPQVFNPVEDIAIDPYAASTEKIINQVKLCPTGALDYFMNNETKKNEEKCNCTTEVQVMTNGPLIVKGDICMCKDGKECENKSGTTAFCRCGHSTNQPFCTGTHTKHPFE